MGKYNRVHIDTNYDWIRDSDNIVIANCTGHEGQHENAIRLASCWNACINFDNPEENIKELIEALNLIKYQIECSKISGKLMLYNTEINAIDKALALVKEDK